MHHCAPRSAWVYTEMKSKLHSGWLAKVDFGRGFKVFLHGFRSKKEFGFVSVVPNHNRGPVVVEWHLD